MNAPAHNLREAALDTINTTEMVRRMAHASFKVWRVINGLSYPDHVAGDTLAEIERALACEAYHGKTFLIAETLALTGKTTLHTVRIRRGKVIGWDANAKRTYAYTADRLCSVAVQAFSPVEPWRWTPGCNVTGADPHLIEARP